MDRFSSAQRSQLMSRVRSKDSGIELMLRRALWRSGLRYRKHYNDLPGKPDIAFIRAKVAVFVDGEFWHGFGWEELMRAGKLPSEFWRRKIARNMERDCEITKLLEDRGWLVLRFWGNQVKGDTEGCVSAIARHLEQRRLLKIDCEQVPGVLPSGLA